MDLKCSTYGPKHERKDLGRSRLSSIFGSRLKLAKIVFFDQTALCWSTQFVKEIFLYLRFYVFNSFLGVEKKKINHNFLDLVAVPSKLGGNESNHNFLQKA
jgi:hypothetical protein